MGCRGPRTCLCTEQAPLAPLLPYALSKAAQEAVAVEAGVRYGFPVVVTRSFNHAGPGQRPVFVVAAMARRVLAVKRGRSGGDSDGQRRRAPGPERRPGRRACLSTAARGGSRRDRLVPRPIVVNVASGRVVTIRWVIEQLCALAGVQPALALDPSLVRVNDPVKRAGDSSLLTSLTGWRPTIPLEQTLADVLADAATTPSAYGDGARTPG